MESKDASYRSLLSIETHSTDDVCDVEGQTMCRPKIPSWRVYILSASPSAAYVVVILTLVILLVVENFHSKTDLQCARQLSVYSPALEAVEYINFDFENDFSSTSIYRGPPTPEREAAWQKLTIKHGVEIPLSKLAALNRSSATNLVYADDGKGYIASLEIFHQLHCLNMIRTYTWYQVSKYPGVPEGLTSDPLNNRMHIDHCIETLRLALQCWGDVTPQFVKVSEKGKEKADFNSHHRCRDFGKIERWIEENWSVE